MKFRLFRNIFYPPNYLQLNVAGIDITDDSIRYTELNNKNGQLSLKNFGKINLPEETIKNGNILNKENIVKALKELKEKISADFIKVSIPEDKSYIFDIELPKEAESNIRESIEFKLEENIPLSPDEAVFEYEIINREGKTDNLFLNISAVSKDTIESMVEIFSLSKLYPVSFEIESKMLARSLIPKNDKRIFVIVNIKRNSIAISAIINGVSRSSLTLPFGEKDLIDEVGKNEVGLKQFPIFFSKVAFEVEKFLEFISFKYYGKEVTHNTSKKIILNGNSTLIDELANYIEGNLDIETTTSNVWTNISEKNEEYQKINRKDSLSFGTAIGMSIPMYKK